MKRILIIALTALAIAAHAGTPTLKPTPSPTLAPIKVGTQVNGSQVQIAYMIGGLPYYIVLDLVVTAGRAPLLFPSPTPSPSPTPTPTPGATP